MPLLPPANKLRQEEKAIKLYASSFRNVNKICLQRLQTNRLKVGGGAHRSPLVASHHDFLLFPTCRFYTGEDSSSLQNSSSANPPALHVASPLSPSPQRREPAAVMWWVSSSSPSPCPNQPSALPLPPQVPLSERGVIRMY